jgi:hypothetical protein
MNTLTAAPYSIPRGDLISVKVQAFNSRGWGALSAVNTVGATAKTIPAQMAAPTRGTDTTTSRIEVDWSLFSTSAETGDSAITSYELRWDAGDGNTPDTVLVGATSDYTSSSFTVSSSVASGLSY